MMSSSGSANALESIILEGGIHDQLSRYAFFSSTHKDGRRYKKSHDTTAFVTRRRSGPVGRSNLSNGPMEYLPKVLISSPDKECGKTTFLELLEAIVLNQSWQQILRRLVLQINRGSAANIPYR